MSVTEISYEWIVLSRCEPGVICVELHPMCSVCIGSQPALCQCKGDLGISNPNICALY